MTTNLSFLIIALAAAVGAASGYLGSLMVLRRMSLVGDALSHVALPGLAIGLLFHFNPFLGAFSALVVATILIWLIENKTKLPTETLVGIFFTLSLAIGLIITPQADLLEALFGEITKTSLWEALIAIILSLLTLIAAHRLYPSLVLGTISEDLAKSIGLPVKMVGLVFLLLVALVVALGIKIVGALLMGALVIIPAATAKNISRNLTSYAWLSAFLGSVSAVLGIYLSQVVNLPPGPAVIISGSAFFFLSLLVKKS